MSWANDYIGIPFRDGGRHDDGRGREAGLDCWGLLRLVYAERRGVLLPSWDAVPARQGAAVATRIAAGLGAWRPVVAASELTGVLLRKGRLSCHVGVMVGGGRFLHVDDDIASGVEALASPLWQRRFAGFFDYVGGGGGLVLCRTA